MAGVTRILIEGFRGANKPLEIRPQGSIMISGPTGSGKTTVLQAIEWGLYGRILGFTGPGFESEDAYVNLFKGQEMATVTLDLTLMDGTGISIQRSRKKGTSSTVRQPSATLTIDGSTFSGPEAQKRIETLIGLDHGKFCQAIFLHQETIRRFVAGDPKDRSAIIDQLLGTAGIRGLAEALDPKRQIVDQIKSLKTTKERLEGEQTQIEVHGQDQLIIQRDRLLAQGYKETDLELKYQNDAIQKMRDRVMQLANAYSVTLSLPPLKIQNGDEAAKTVEILITTISELDRARGSRIADKKGEIEHIDALTKQYKGACEQAPQKPRASNELNQQMRELEATRTALVAQRDALRDQANSLEQNAKEHLRLLSLVEQEEKNLGAYSAKYGDLATLKKTRDDNVITIGQLNEEIEKEGMLAKLLAFAQSYIEASLPSSCPVCEQDIEAQTVVSRLEEENKKRGDQLLQKQKQVETLLTENRRIDPFISKIEKTSLGLDSLREDANQQLKHISKMMGQEVSSAGEATAVAKEKWKTISDLEGQIDKVKDDVWQLEQERDKVQRLDTTLGQLEKTLQKLLSVQVIKQKLIESAERRLQELRSGMSKIEDVKSIDSLRQQLISIKQVAEYVKNVEDLEKQGKSLFKPRIEALTHQITQLEELNASLQTLREIVSEQHGTLTTKAINEFEKSIQYYYNQLKGHPYFGRIRIEPLATEPVTYDIKAFDDKGKVETHANARFSTGQIDATALAIFLSVNEKLAKNMSILILDDPTQNMDNPHKEALAETLGTLSRNRQLIVASHDEQFAQQILGNVKTGIEQLIMQDWTTDGPRPKAP